MKVAVLGTGYVGLVSGTCLSAKGHSVVCIDKNKRIVETISSGQSPIHEPELEEILKDNLQKGNLKVTSNLRASISSADIVIVAVGTPSDDAGYIDLQYILQAVKEIGKILKDNEEYCCVVIKSTVVPGTTMKEVLPIIEKYSGKELGDFGLCVNPEFLREGSAVQDFMNPDRIIIGASDKRSSKYVEELYSMFNVPKLVTNPTTAELIKYANNSLLAMLISFSNELSRIADHLPEVDIKDVLRGVHLDQRWSPLCNGERVFPGILNYLLAGCGYGGSCFPKDINALELFASHMGIDTPLITATRSINITQPEYSVMLLERQFGDIARKNVGVLGLAFKPDTDDVRETPAFRIIYELLKRDAIVWAHDPLPGARNNFIDHFGEYLNGAWNIVDNFNIVIGKSDVLSLITPWQEYLKKDWTLLANQYPNLKMFFDARRMVDPSLFSKTNCRYCGIGYGYSKGVE